MDQELKAQFQKFLEYRNKKAKEIMNEMLEANGVPTDEKEASEYLKANDMILDSSLKEFEGEDGEIEFVVQVFLYKKVDSKTESVKLKLEY